MASRFQIVYILSTTYAGSHFLALQLGSHHQCASIGEFHHFRKGRQRRAGCPACGSYDACPVFKGMTSTHKRDLYTKLFANVRDYDPAVQTVIDNSKKVSWAARWLKFPDVTQKYIHIIRDPRAIMRRWMISREGAEAAKVRRKTARRCWPMFWSILRASEAEVYLYKWHHQNKAITAFLNRNALDAKVVTYHDLVYYPDRVLQELMQWIGYDYEPSQRQYWRFPHHGSVKPQYMVKPDTDKPFHDQRWREFLAPEEKQMAFSHAGIRKYLAESHIEYNEANGLIGLIGKAAAQSNDLTSSLENIRT